jgi:hypothetical protein
MTHEVSYLVKYLEKEIWRNFGTYPDADSALGGRNHARKDSDCNRARVEVTETTRWILTEDS